MKRVGRYELVEEIAEGGMGTVWRGRDADGHLVAVKLLRAAIANEPVFREALRNEVHLTARLDHPGVIRLHGWGEVAGEEAAVLAVEPGAPWIAMELAADSFELSEVRDWDGLRRLATELLEALMHSHARGVIHRDLKPGNLLLGSDGRYIITDFGIAFPNRQIAHQGQSVRAPTAGTLNYMAPEQLLGRWRDFGPYTDLFSLGVLFYQIVTGNLPFDAPNRLDLGLQHQRGAPRFGSTRFAVPGGVEEWLQTLLRFNPRERFAFAADAAWALEQVGDFVAPPEVSSPLIVESGGTTLAMDAELPTLAMDPATTIEAWGSTIHIGGPVRAPLRTDWRPETPPARERIAVGLDLFGLRSAPITGRDVERDLMWAQLLRTIEEQRGHGILLRGEAGLGKSRLAQWLCERAHELGVADFTHILHSPSARAVPEVLRQQFRLWNLPPADARERMAELLGPDLSATDLDVIQRVMGGDSAGLGEQTLLLERLLCHFSAERPLIVWLDDVHGSIEAIEAAAALSKIEAPVLFVLTVREEELDDLPVQRAQLTSYGALPQVLELELTSFESAAMRSLLDDALALDPTLRDDVVADAAGNPLRAWQVLQLSLQEGSVSADASGRVRGEIHSQPTGEVWLRRLREAVQDERPVLVAAVLGHRVDPASWLALCGILEFPADIGLAHRLVEAGLWTSERGAWAFEHGSLREALLAATEPAQRQRIHAAAAALFDAAGSQTFLQHGWHQVYGGNLAEGVEVLLSGLSVLYAEGRNLTARSVMASIRRHLESSSADPRVLARAEVAEAGIAFESMNYEESRMRAGRVLADAVANEWHDIASRSANVLACVSEGERDLRPALEYAEQARDYARLAGDRDLEERASCRVGWALSRMGRYADAKEAFRFATTSQNEVVRDRAHVGLAHACEALGDLGEAERHLEVCIDLAREGGRRAQLADALNSRASIAAKRGRLRDSASYYEEAYRLSRLERSLMQYIISLNWAVLLARAGDADECVAKAEHALAGLPDGNPFLAAYGEFVLLLGAAVAGDARRWEDHVGALTEPRFAGDVEFAEVQLVMAQAWMGHGDADRAAAATDAGLKTLDGLTGAEALKLRARLSAVARSTGDGLCSTSSKTE